MSRRLIVLFAAFSVALVSTSVLAQAPASRAPRTPDGKPDLQGFWDFATLTPLERPANLKDKAVLTEDEAKTLQKQNAERRDRAAASSEVRATARAAGGGAAGRAAARSPVWRRSRPRARTRSCRC